MGCGLGKVLGIVWFFALLVKDLGSLEIVDFLFRFAYKKLVVFEGITCGVSFADNYTKRHYTAMARLLAALYLQNTCGILLELLLKGITCGVPYGGSVVKPKTSFWQSWDFLYPFAYKKPTAF